MARTATKTTGTTTSTKTTTASAGVKATTSAEPKIKKKVFENAELIPCKSVTSGELVMVGHKTGNIYKWADCDYIEEVEYQDLIYAVKTHSAFITRPMFIILDDEFISQNKEIEQMYSGLYSFSEINEILSLPPDVMRDVITSLPDGIKNAIKGVAATAINNGSFDSIKKIKILDEIFGTSMLQLLLDK